MLPSLCSPSQLQNWFFFLIFPTVTLRFYFNSFFPPPQNNLWVMILLQQPRESVQVSSSSTAHPRAQKEKAYNTTLGILYFRMGGEGSHENSTLPWSQDYCGLSSVTLYWCKNRLFLYIKGIIWATRNMPDSCPLPTLAMQYLIHHYILSEAESL